MLSWWRSHFLSSKDGLPSFLNVIFVSYRIYIGRIFSVLFHPFHSFSQLWFLIRNLPIELFIICCFSWGIFKMLFSVMFNSLWCTRYEKFEFLFHCFFFYSVLIYSRGRSCTTEPSLTLNLKHSSCLSVLNNGIPAVRIYFDSCWFFFCYESLCPLPNLGDLKLLFFIWILCCCFFPGISVVQMIKYLVIVPCILGLSLFLFLFILVNVYWSEIPCLSFVMSSQLLHFPSFCFYTFQWNRFNKQKKLIGWSPEKNQTISQWSYVGCAQFEPYLGLMTTVGDHC